MGTVQPARDTRPTFVGVAKAEGEEPPTLNEALESAALKAMAYHEEFGGEPLIGGERTAWFDVSFVRVELGNQHPRTFKVGVTYDGPGS
jgi:hypothetical protein